MRFSTALLSFSALSNSLALVASPIEARGKALDPSVSSLLAKSILEARAPICNREFSQVADVVQNSFTGKAQISFAISGGGITYHVCKIVAHHGNKPDLPCTQYAGLVAFATGFIIEIQQLSSTPVDGTHTSDRRQLTNPSLDTFVGHLNIHGFESGPIETPAIVRRNDNESDSSAADVAEHFIVRDVQHPDLSVAPADVHFKSYTNGTGYLHFRHQPAQGSLRKRHDGAGFKYNWHNGYWDPSSRTADINQISYQVGQGIANNWAYDADYFLLDQWIGAAGIDYIYIRLIGVAIRIIPELNGFGEEYEDVNICGDMTDPIHDELK